MSVRDQGELLHCTGKISGFGAKDTGNALSTMNACVLMVYRIVLKNGSSERTL
ncbi:MAG: hypothetical protein ACP5G0_11060 [Desulfomonilia bacterium]